MTKLCISTQWNDDFLRECAQYKVHEAYGSLRTGAVGSARPAVCLPETTVEHAREHIALAHELGVQFNYVINAPCMGNMEYDPNGRRALREYLDLVEGLGVDTVTVAIPYLIEIIKHTYPRLKVKASEIANINSAQRAQYYVNQLGVDVLTLEITVNRDFQVLESIRRAVASEIELELVVNAACLYQCPYHDYHSVIVGHSGQEGHELRGYYVDYCMMRCIPAHLRRPAELLKARWIRPEDMVYYETLGIDRFKVSNRVGPLRMGRTCLEAYSRRRIDDLAKLLTPLSLNLEEPPDARLPGFSQGEWDQVKLFWGMRAPRVQIDNTKLDGFLRFFHEGQCHGQCDAGGCNYCEEWARQAVHVDGDAVARYVDVVDQLTSPMLSLREGAGSSLESAGGVVAWLADVERLFEQVIASVPEIFRDVARFQIRRCAESLAAQRRSSRVEKQDLALAVWTETPDPFKTDLAKQMDSLGLEIASHDAGGAGI